MARKPRDQSEGVRHIWCRGNRKHAIFSDDYDREHYLRLLAKVAKKLEWRVIAYCLMTNHVHLLIEVPAFTIARGMQILNGEYAQYINRRHGYVGHLWQGRYSASRVDDESYCLQLDRYIVNNPVRAGMVDVAADWQWSSFRAALGKVAPPAYLDTQWTLKQFAHRLDRARTLYQDFVDAARTADRPPVPEPRGQTPVQVPRGRSPTDQPKP